jgi:hypothetical protein
MVKTVSPEGGVLLVGVSGAMVRRRTRRRKKRTVYPGLGAAPARKTGAWLVLVLSGLVVVNLYVFVWDKHTGVAAIREQAEAARPALALPTAQLALPTAATHPAAGPIAGPPVALKRAPTPGGDPGAAIHCGDVQPTGIPASGCGSIEGRVSRSDTLGRLLKKNGLTAAETDELIRALSGVLDFRTIRAGQVFHITRGGDGRVVHFDLEVAKSRRVRADRRSSGDLAAVQE